MKQSRKTPLFILAVLVLTIGAHALASESADNALGLEQDTQTPAISATQEAAALESLTKPMFTPLVERYILDELKHNREAMAELRVEMTREFVERELTASDKALTYASNTVTYFFYLIAGVSSILVIVGWNSLKDIRERVVKVAESEVTKLVKQYEGRLQGFEKTLLQKAEAIDRNKEKIEQTQEIHALWMRAGLEDAPSSKIGIYDQILERDPRNYEALTYKADALLQMSEPQWAISLCQQALAIDPDYGHAFYQLACAATQMGNLEEAVYHLAEALKRSETIRSLVEDDSALEPLRKLKAYKALMETTTPTYPGN